MNIICSWFMSDFHHRFCVLIGESRGLLNLSGFKWSKPGKERQISYDMAYMWNLKKMTEIDPQTQEKETLPLSKERGRGGVQ